MYDILVNIDDIASIANKLNPLYAKKNPDGYKNFINNNNNLNTITSNKVLLEIIFKTIFKTYEIQDTQAKQSYKKLEKEKDVIEMYRCSRASATRYSSQEIKKDGNNIKSINDTLKSLLKCNNSEENYCSPDTTWHKMSSLFALLYKEGILTDENMKFIINNLHNTKQSQELINKVQIPSYLQQYFTKKNIQQILKKEKINLNQKTKEKVFNDTQYDINTETNPDDTIVYSFIRNKFNEDQINKFKKEFSKIPDTDDKITNIKKILDTYYNKLESPKPELLTNTFKNTNLNNIFEAISNLYDKIGGVDYYESLFKYVCELTNELPQLSQDLKSDLQKQLTQITKKNDKTLDQLIQTSNFVDNDYSTNMNLLYQIYYKSGCLALNDVNDIPTITINITNIQDVKCKNDNIVNIFKWFYVLSTMKGATIKSVIPSFFQKNFNFSQLQKFLPTNKITLTITIDNDVLKIKQQKQQQKQPQLQQKPVQKQQTCKNLIENFLTNIDTSNQLDILNKLATFFTEAKIDQTKIHTIFDSLKLDDYYILSEYVQNK